MRDYYWIIPGLLAGRPGPRMLPWNLEALWEEGFRSIVSLIRADRASIEQAGFRHCYSPMMGAFTILPFWRRWLAQKMLPIVDFIAGELAAGRPTLVHCQMGKDRTGAVLAGYLVRYCGFSPQAAFERLRQVNPRAMTAPGFKWMPRQFGSWGRREGVGCGELE